MKSLYKFIFFAIFMAISMNAYAGDYKFTFDNGSDSFTTEEGDGIFPLKMMIKINQDNSLFAVIEKQDGSVFNDGSVSLFVNDYQIIQVNRLANIELGLNKDDVPIYSENRLDDIIDGWTPQNNSEIYDSIVIYGVYDLGNDISYVGPANIVREKLPSDAYVRILIDPEAVTSDARWRVVGTTTWLSSGESVAINPNSVIEDPEYPFNKPTVDIEFMDIPDWNKPDNTTVTISRGITITSDAHTYIQDTTAISVKLCPQLIEEDVFWRIYNNGKWSTWYESGEIVKGLNPGNKPVEFSTLTGWDPPGDNLVTLESGKTEFLSVCYCEQVPAPPENILATRGKYTDRITIWWTNSPSDSSSCDVVYKLYRGTEDDPNKATLIVPSITENSYDDYNATHDSKYYYWVKAKGTATGNFSKSCMGYKKLESPSGVSAASFPVSCEEDFPDRIRIAYSESDGADVVEIWRAVEVSDLKKAVRIISNAPFSSYDDFTAIANRVYAYWVVAKNDFSVSDPSLFAWGTKCLSPPKTVRASFDEYTEYVLINWDLVTDATCYRVIRTALTDKRSVKIRSSNDICSPPYYDRTAVPGVRYEYQVISVNNYGVKESRPSNFDIGRRKMPVPPIITASKGTKVYQIDIEWTHIPDATKGYQLYRGIKDDVKEAELLADNILGNSYPDTPVYRAYFYWVKAVGEHAVSDFSDSADGFPILCNQVISIVPVISEYPYQESTGFFNVSFDISLEVERNKCVWDTFTDDNWITLATFQGQGDGRVDYTVGENSGNDRTGFISVTTNASSLTHTVKQINIFTLTIDILGNGSVSVNGTNYSEPIKFNSGQEVNLSYLPENGWNSDPNNPSSITMDNNKNITIKFNPKLTITTEGNGQVTSSVSDVHLGDTVSLNAIADEGWTFKNWTMDLTGSENPETIVMNAPTSVGAVFEPEGWKADITIERLNTFQSVSFGIRSVEETSIAEITGEHACSLVIPKMPEWNPYLDIDIRLQGKKEYSWVLRIDPAGTSVGSNDTPAIVRWNPDQFTDYGHYILTEGFNSDGQVVIPNMRDTREFPVPGNDLKYYTIRWRSEPWHPTIRLFGAEQIGTYKCSVEIDVCETAKRTDLAPEPPKFSCDLSIIPAPDWNSRLATLIYEDGEDEYNWVFAANPSGNVGDETATSILTWDFSTFSGQGGYWKLIEGYEGHYGDVVVQDMSKISQINVTGKNKKYYYTIRWTRWGYVDLDLKEGWNLITIPLIPNNGNGNGLFALFPEITAAYEFSDGAYASAKEATLEPGKGYWINLPSDMQYRIWGEPVYNVELDLLDGWILLGGVYGNTKPVDDPDGCIEAIFNYVDGKYNNPETIVPGCGFWIKLSEACHVSMDSY